MVNWKLASITVVVLVVAARVVLARPSSLTPLPLELSTVLNRTVCPMRSYIDNEANRIPRRIKFVKCVDHPEEQCSAAHTHACCRKHHHNYMTECVEVFDWVLVTYRDGDKISEPERLKVSVGCNCMIREGTAITEVF